VRRRAPRFSSASPRAAVYAGSFDPPTLGHLYLIEEGARLFDRLVVAVGANPDKTYTFSLQERLGMLRACARGRPGVEVAEFEGRFLMHFARSLGARYVLRGIRNAQDLDFEETLCHVNRAIAPEVTPVFLLPPRNLAGLSSSFVKGLIGPAGWRTVVRRYLPRPVYPAVLRRYAEGPRDER